MWFLVDYAHGYTKEDHFPIVTAGICLGPALLYFLSNQHEKRKKKIHVLNYLIFMLRLVFFKNADVRVCKR
jgi:hypothetical protein